MCVVGKCYHSILTWHCKTNVASSEAFQGLFILMERTGIVLSANPSISAQYFPRFSSAFKLSPASQQRAKGSKPSSETYRSIQHCGDKIISNSFHFIHCLVSLVQFFWFSKDGAFRIHTYNLEEQFPLRPPRHTALESRAPVSTGSVTAAGGTRPTCSPVHFLLATFTSPGSKRLCCFWPPWKPIPPSQTDGTTCSTHGFCLV